MDNNQGQWSLTLGIRDKGPHQGKCPLGDTSTCDPLLLSDRALTTAMPGNIIAPGLPIQQRYPADLALYLQQILWEYIYGHLEITVYQIHSPSRFKSILYKI